MSYIATSLIRYLFNRGVDYYRSNHEQIHQNIRDIRDTIVTMDSLRTNIIEQFREIRERYEEYDDRDYIQDLDNDNNEEKFNGIIVNMNNIEPGSTCSICLESYNENDEIALSACKHHFHLECVEKWMFRQRSCPICRGSI